jgi:hypothetical protein
MLPGVALPAFGRQMAKQDANIAQRHKVPDSRDFQGPRQLARPIRAGQLGLLLTHSIPAKYRGSSLVPKCAVVNSPYLADP